MDKTSVIAYSKLISRGALLALIGYIASGPVGFVVMRLIKPQPPWISPAELVANYHIVQDIPFYFGFMLVGGMLMLAVGYYLSTDYEQGETKFRTLLGLSCTAVFVALISFNYICQTTFVRHMVLNYRPELDGAITMFSMANPLSFCWANEIWGYGFLGVGTWLASAFYSERNKLIQGLMIANGVVSVGTVGLVVANTAWLMTILRGLSPTFRGMF